MICFNEKIHLYLFERINNPINKEKIIKKNIKIGIVHSFQISIAIFFSLLLSKEHNEQNRYDYVVCLRCIPIKPENI